jgi:hypothetical protein
MLDWPYILAVIYGIIALLHFVGLSRLIGGFGTGIIIFVWALFWPIVWIWFLVDYFRGRVA